MTKKRGYANSTSCLLQARNILKNVRLRHDEFLLIGEMKEARCEKQTCQVLET